jgi:ABC-type multidrug transport system fused ATPase/permease subunit
VTAAARESADRPNRQPAAEGFRQGWMMLVRDLAALRGPLTRVIAWSVVQGLPSLISGHVIADALDRGFLVHRPATGLLYLLVLGLTLGVSAAAAWAMFPWLAATVEPLRDTLVRRLVIGAVHRAAVEGAPPDNVTIARLTGQVEAVRGLVGAILRSARQSAVLLVAALVGLATLAPVVALFVLVPLAASGAVFALSLKALATRRRALVLLDEAIASESGYVLPGVRDIVACNASDRASRRVHRLIGERAVATRRLARAGALRTVVVILGGQLPLLGLLAAAPWLLDRGELNAGQLIGAAAYITAGLLPAIRSIVTVITTWGIQLGTVLQRLHEAAAVPGERAADADAREPAGYAIDVDGLTFAYGAQADPVIRDLYVQIAEGEHIAVVGPSGAGKSTFTRLLVGALHAQSGDIRIGGVPVRRFPAGRLHETIALIPQEAYVFAGSLRENLAYLCPDACERQLSAAAEATGLRSLVERLGGYDALVGAGGATLSSGEAQLVALTRVYLSAAWLVILDEASCHLDPAAEARVEEAFIARPGTLIVVAHRISSAERAGRILLLDGPRTMIGSAQELARRSLLYADLLGYWQPGADDGTRALGPVPV